MVLKYARKLTCPLKSHKQKVTNVLGTRVFNIVCKILVCLWAFENLYLLGPSLRVLRTDMSFLFTLFWNFQKQLKSFTFRGPCECPRNAYRPQNVGVHTYVGPHNVGHFNTPKQTFAVYQSINIFLYTNLIPVVPSKTSCNLAIRCREHIGVSTTGHKMNNKSSAVYNHFFFHWSLCIPREF